LKRAAGARPHSVVSHGVIATRDGRGDGISNPIQAFRSPRERCRRRIERLTRFGRFRPSRSIPSDSDPSEVDSTTKSKKIFSGAFHTARGTIPTPSTVISLTWTRIICEFDSRIRCVQKSRISPMNLASSRDALRKFCERGIVRCA